MFRTDEISFNHSDKSFDKQINEISISFENIRLFLNVVEK